MLTSDLLVTRTYRGRIEPVYAPLDQETLEIAGSVIDTFQGHVGRTYGELADELEGFEKMDYRLIRGLSQILERRCVIDKDSAVDPIAARRAVFEESRGLAAGAEERKEVLDRVAGKLSIKPEDLEKALWADQEENLVIKEFRVLNPEDLLRQYNLSLAQTLLFKATGMEIQIEDNYQPVFWKIKRLGLMYSIQDDKIILEGALSVFKLTERYGTAFAELLPSIIKSRRWRLEASIIRKTPQGKRIYDFVLDHTKRDSFSAEPGIEGAPGFDSAIEKEFYQLSFNGWAVKREPAVLKAGQYAFIPDFSLERNGTKIYLEIIGFWTPEYLKNKVQKINQLEGKENMILLVNRNLACSGSEFKTDNLIFYDKKIPHLEIIKVLRRYEERQLTEEVEKLRSMDISLMDISLDPGMNVVSLDEVAGRYGVSQEALREILKGQGKTDYQLLGDQLISNRILKVIQDELDGVEKYDDALQILKGHGIKAHGQVLEILGYKVRWSGLNPDNAKILKHPICDN